MIDNKLAKMPLSNWGGLNFKCRCGNRHQIDVKEIVVRDDACALIPFFAKKIGRNVQVVFEQKVFEQTKDKIFKKFGKGFQTNTALLPDENLLSVDTCNKVVENIDEQTNVLVCVGGKNANNFGKYASEKLGVQWIFVHVLPDSDDVATSYAMLWQNSVNVMFNGKSPDVILCDLSLAFDFCKDGVNDAFAIVLRNMLCVFDNSFAKVVQNAQICQTANFILTSCIKDSVNLTKKPFSKNTVEGLFNCLYRISFAKSLAKAKVDNFSGMHALLFALQSKYPEFSEGSLSCAVSDVLAKTYAVVLATELKICLPKDRLAHSEIIKKHFGLEVDSTYNWCVDDEAYKQNRVAFAKNVELVKKVQNLCNLLVKDKPSWDKEVAEVCLKVSSDIYTYNGLLSYANDKGLFDDNF